MKTVYVVMADIRDHTEWAEQHSPKELSDLLKTFYAIPNGKCIHVNANSDEMTLFYNSIEEAIKSARKLREFGNNKLGMYGLSLGVSLHKGEVDLLKYTKNKVKYKTYVGHSICVGKRLETLCYGGDIVISDEIYQELSAEEREGFTISKQVKLRGIKNPLKVHISVL